MLYTRTGTSYAFDPAHRLNRIIDATSNNTIAFSYANNMISCITDTVGRAFVFSYSAGLLQSISQVNGSCANPGSSIRSVAYGNNGQSLTSVTDPGNRVTAYQYGAVTNANVAAWLISRMVYPTQAYSNYTYTPVGMGTQASSYRVARQLVSSPSSAIRRFDYSYSQTSGGDQVTNSTVRSYDGSSGTLQLVGYTRYSFSFAGVTMNISDANNRLVRGLQQRFGVSGEVPREIVLVTDGSGTVGSYTNYYRYDLWGNQIYSRRSINPSSNSYHESFNAYYNNGLPPGFYAFQETFSQNQGTASDNPWNVYNGTWLVKNGVYNGTARLYQNPGWSYFAWANASTPDISVQASVYATRNVTSSDQRFGLFVHYPGSGIYKWALVLRNRPNPPGPSGTYLELLDEAISYLSDGSAPYGQASARVSCALNTGIWYTFNMTIHGYSATGWASAPGQPTCSVSGTFPSSSPAATGTGFGLYAGGYSTLFDDVRVATVSPTITGTGFSNSFISSGAPGPTGVNTWLGTTKPPGSGWNSIVNWLPASGWSQAPRVQDYGGSPWGTFTGWSDSKAQWIWWSGNANVSASADPVWFRRVFNINTPTALNIQVTADNAFTLYVDGNLCTAGSAWTSPQSCTIQTLQPGFHVLAVNATNPDGQTASQPNPDPAGFLLTASANGQVLFHTDGVAGSNIVSLAGTAQLQNGAGSLPMESYYSYYSWGGLNRQKNRYDSTNSPLAIDGSAQAFCVNTTSSCSATLTTTRMNDIIIAFAFEALDQQTTCSFSISDTAGLTWIARGGGVTGRGGRDQLQEFWAKRPSILTSDTITESITGCGNNYNGLQVFAVSGANIDSPFDPASGLPASAAAYSGGTSVTLSTSNPNDIVFAAVQHGSRPVPTPQSGFTIIVSTGGWSAASEYQVVSSTLTNFAVTFGDSATDYWEEIADAIQAPPTQWLVSSRVYDGYGNLNTLTDANGKTAYYAYSSSYQSAYLTNQTLLVGSTRITSRYSYNYTLGTVASRVDPNGYNTTYQYDILSRSTGITYPNGLGFVAYGYNDTANYVNITNGNGWKTRQIYDGLARQAISDRFLNGVSYSNKTDSYDWQNNVVARVDPLGNIYRYKYDALARMINATGPDGLASLQFYNDLASWVRLVDQDGNSKCNIYDRLGRLVSAVEKASTDCQTGIVTNYYYNEAGSLTKVTNSLLKSTNYNYDNLGQLIGTAYADTTWDSYTYDSNGNVVKKIDRKNVNTLYSYDSLNRLTTATYCGTPMTSRSYTYDANGNVLQVQNENATVTYTYDARNRPLNEKYEVNLASRQIVDLGCSGTGGTSTASGGVSKTYTISYSYNGEVLDTITYPTITTTNIAVKFSYDGLGRVLSLTQLGTAISYAQLSYYQNDKVMGVQYGNGLTGNYTYDSLARPLSITLNNGATALLSLTYGYNRTGTVASVTGQVNGVTVNEQYRYDPLRRLTNATVTSQGTTTTLWYEYDNLGNRQRQSLNGVVTRYNYTTTNNQLTASSTSGTSIAYSYDLNGNLKTQNVTTSGTTHWTYNWDVPGRLLKASNDGGTQGLYAYDGKGRLVEQVEGSYTVFFSYFGTETLFKTIQGSTSTDYLYAAGMRIARIAESDGQFSLIRYYHTDHLGSTRLVTNSVRSVIFVDSYQPFGQDNGTPTDLSVIRPPHKFAGKPWSASTGLYYFYQRWYDPTTGRFISQDPRLGHLFNPQTLNLYVYVANDPVEYNDPSGEFLNIVIGAAAGALIGWGMCGVTTGAWFSSQCGVAALAGGVGGGVAGATFGLSLAAMGVGGAGVEGGAVVGATLAQSVVAGALSGAASSVASYLTSAAFGVEKFSWQGLANNALFGLGIGAITGGVGWKFFGPVTRDSLNPLSLKGEISALAKDVPKLLSAAPRSVQIVVGSVVNLARAAVGAALTDATVLQTAWNFVTSVFVPQPASQTYVPRDIGNRRG